MDSRLLCGDVREVLPTLDAGSVQCVVTSPPYWGLRDYGTATWDGGNADCDHAAAKQKSMYDYSLDTSPIQDKSRTGTDAPRWNFECPTCGAKRIDNQIGLEQTPEAYVTTMVKVFREVKRVLRDDGTLWLNLGDSYCATGIKGAYTDPKHPEGRNGQVVAVNAKIEGLKPKDLVGIPWRVAFALQADGWYLRSDIIWAKGVSFCPDYSGSVMPESVTDRPTKSHEYLFLLTKSPRYYYDADAVREQGTGRDWSKVGGNIMGKGVHKVGAQYQTIDRDGRESATGRNLRSVWTINPQHYSEAHFATFPTALVEPCVKAGTKKKDTVLDPFAGSGTTGLVAGRLGRGFIGIELSTDYYTLADERMNGPLFAASGRPSSGQHVQGEIQDRTNPLRRDDGRPEPATRGDDHA